jgi:predicted nucleic acid-binding protein
MSKREFVIDEWIYHRLAKEETLDATATFLKRVFEVCDKMVLREDTPLTKKIYNLSEESSYAVPKKQAFIKWFMKAFLYNTNKVKWVQESDIVPIPETTKKDIPDTEDFYIIEMAHSTADKILITSDQKLKATLEKYHAVLKISVYFADDVVKRYPNL